MATVAIDRSFAWRDHWVKFAVAAPVFAAAITLAVSESQYRLLGGAAGPVSDAAVVAIVLGNALFALLGSAAGGLMIRGSIVKRLAVAFACGLSGLLAYGALGEIGPTVVGWLTP